MERTLFVNTILDHYSDVSAEDVLKMLERGFLIDKELYLNSYIANRDAFYKKYDLFKDTELYLTSGELDTCLRNNLDGYIGLNLNSQALNAAAEYNILKAGKDFREITIAADESAVYEGGSVKDAAATASLHKNYRIFLFTPQCAEKQLQEWEFVANALNERLEQLKNDDIEDKLEHFRNTPPETETPDSEKISPDGAENAPVIVQENVANKKKPKTRKKTRNGIALPLSDGSTLYVSTDSFEDYSVNVNTSSSLCLTDTALDDVLLYVKQHSDANDSIQVTKVDNYGNEEVIWGQDNGEYVGSLGDFKAEYYSGRDIPEYSTQTYNDSMAVQYSIGTVDYTDNSHNAEFILQTEAEGAPCIIWKAPEYAKDASPEVIADAFNKAKELYGDNLNVVIEFQPTDYSGSELKQPFAVPAESFFDQLSDYKEENSGNATFANLGYNKTENITGNASGAFYTQGYFAEAKAEASNSFGNATELEAENGVKTGHGSGSAFAAAPQFGSTSSLGNISELYNGGEVSGENFTSAKNFSPLMFTVKETDANGQSVVTTISVDLNLKTIIHTEDKNGSSNSAILGFASELTPDKYSNNSTDRMVGNAEAYEKAMDVSEIFISNGNGEQITIGSEYLDRYGSNFSDALNEFRVQQNFENANGVSAALISLMQNFIANGIDINEDSPSTSPEALRKIAKEHSTTINETNSEFFARNESLTDCSSNTEAQLECAIPKSTVLSDMLFTGVHPFKYMMAGTAYAIGAQTVRNGFSYIAPIGVILDVASKGTETIAKQKFLKENSEVIDSIINLKELGIEGSTSSAKGRREAIKAIHNQLKDSDGLKNIGADKMSLAQLKKIAETGMYHGRELSTKDLNIINKLILLKGANAGDLSAFNAADIVSAKLGINLTGHYNLSKKADIAALRKKIEDASANRFTKGNLNLYIREHGLANKDAKQLARFFKKNNVSEQDQELISFYLQLNKLEKNIELKAHFGRNTFRRLLRGALSGTAGGSALVMADRIRKMKRILSTIREERTKLILKRMNKEKGLSGLYNRSKLGQFENKINTKKFEIIKKHNDKKVAKARAKEIRRSKKREAAKARIRKTKIATKIRRKKERIGETKFGRIAGKAGRGISKVLRAPGVVVSKLSSFKNLLGAKIKAIKMLLIKVALIALGIFVAFDLLVWLISAASTAVTGFLYKGPETIISKVIDEIKYGEGEETEDDGTPIEYTNLAPEETIVNERMEYCIAMDSSLKTYIEQFYTDKEVCKDVINNKSFGLKKKDDKDIKEFELWYDPNAKETLQNNFEGFGVKIGGVQTGIHYTYYDGDGHIISMKSNAKDILATANVWMGSGLDAIGLYKSYVEALWNYSHAVGYAPRETPYKNYVYSCDSHSGLSECSNNVYEYFCNDKNAVIYSEKGQNTHNGLDSQIYYNQATQNFVLSNLFKDSNFEKNSSTGNIDKKITLTDITFDELKTVAEKVKKDGSLGTINISKVKNSSGYPSFSAKVLEQTKLDDSYAGQEEGSWIWTQQTEKDETKHDASYNVTSMTSGIGCVRHEPTFHQGKEANDVTSKVLIDSTDKIRSLMEKNVNNSVTTAPYASFKRMYFTSNKQDLVDAGCDAIQQVQYYIKDNNGNAVKKTAYYCTGHLPTAEDTGCTHEKTVMEVWYNGCQYHKGVNPIIERDTYYKLGSFENITTDTSSNINPCNNFEYIYHKALNNNYTSFATETNTSQDSRLPQRKTLLYKTANCSSSSAAINAASNWVTSHSGICNNAVVSSPVSTKSSSSTSTIKKHTVSLTGPNANSASYALQELKNKGCACIQSQIKQTQTYKAASSGTTVSVPGGYALSKLSVSGVSASGREKCSDFFGINKVYNAATKADISNNSILNYHAGGYVYFYKTSNYVVVYEKYLLAQGDKTPGKLEFNAGATSETPAIWTCNGCMVAGSTETTVYYCEVYCAGHYRCLGHICPTLSGSNEEFPSVSAVFCSGYCAGHKLKEYCTGHVDLDVGIVTLFNENNNNLAKLGIFTNSEVKEEKYSPGKILGFIPDGTQMTVTTHRNSGDGKKTNELFKDTLVYEKGYFTNNGAMSRLTKYVFKSDDGDKFVLPKYEGVLNNEYVENTGSFVSGPDITDGLKFLRCFITGEGVNIHSHSKMDNGNMIGDKAIEDHTISLYDILASYYVSFEVDKYKDYNDDSSQVGVSIGLDLSNMPSVAKKNTKEHYFNGFYQYKISDSDETRGTIDLTNTIETDRIDAIMQEDWKTYYGMEFPGSYNAYPSDIEVQKLMIDIAQCLKKSIPRIKGEISEIAQYIPTLYNFKNGSGLLSVKDETGSEKTTNGLGLPSKIDDKFSTVGDDQTDFALYWASKIYMDLYNSTKLERYKEVSEFYLELYNEVAGDINYYKNLTSPPKWLIDTYGGGTNGYNRAKKAIEYYTGITSTGVQFGIDKLKVAYVKNRLTAEYGDYVEQAHGIKGNIIDAKAGDLLCLGDEIYLVLYNTSSLQTKRRYEQGYKLEENGFERGKIVLMTISSPLSNNDGTYIDSIHAFSYSLELLKESESFWFFSV